MTHAIALPAIGTMTPAHQAAVSYLARYTGHTHDLYRYCLHRWFSWCHDQQLDPLEGIQRPHLELYVRHLHEAGVPLRDAQHFARHADPRTTERYDLARQSLDRHGVHILTAYVAGC